jgi:hypothetical protein
MAHPFSNPSFSRNAYSGAANTRALLEEAVYFWWRFMEVSLHPDA